VGAKGSVGQGKSKCKSKYKSSMGAQRAAGSPTPAQTQAGAVRRWGVSAAVEQAIFRKNTKAA